MRLQTAKTMNEYYIIGREYEQKLIKGYLDSDKAELVAVYGRRRVGKTYLVKSIFENNFDFAFTGLYDVTRAVHLAQFKNHHLWRGQKQSQWNRAVGSDNG